ncbi:MAG: ribbon-helix-helix domain-containing protein [Nanoarchaeota archaeon]
METVSLKLDGKFAKNMERVMKENNYTTKTEFIREAVRDKIKKLEIEQALERARKLFGASRLKTTDEKRHKAGEMAVLELEKEFGL